MKCLVIWLIRLYQLFLANFIQVILLSLFGFSAKCKFTPSCSEYTIIQVKNHGTIIGLKKGLARILACH